MGVPIASMSDWIKVGCKTTGDVSVSDSLEITGTCGPTDHHIREMRGFRNIGHGNEREMIGRSDSTWGKLHGI